MIETTLSVGDKSFRLAPEYILEAMFATISYRLEPDGRASRFPLTMTHLYKGYLDSKDADAALAELATIEIEMKNLTPDRAVWNLNDLARLDPANQPLNGAAKNAYELFIAADRRPLIAVLREAVYECRSRFQPLTLVAQAPSVTKKAHLRTALTVLLMIGAGLFLTISNWRTLINEGYYYPKASFFGPPLVIFGILSLFRWSELAEGYSGQRRMRKGKGEPGKVSKVFWVIVVILALAAGGINVYWLDNYFK